MDFLPVDGISFEWLGQLYWQYVARSKATGKDGISQIKFRENLRAECDLIVNRVNAGTYKFTTFKEVLISRGPERNPRQISVPTIRDRLVIRACLEHLKHLFPKAVSPPPHRYIKDIKSFLKSRTTHDFFLRMDIRDFYPSISHEYLLSLIESHGLDPRFVSVIRSAIETPTGNGSGPLRRGVPQGLAFSNILASISMQEFDDIADSEIFYRRYVDDILVIASAEEIIAIHQALERGLKNLSLLSHPLGTPGKTEILGVNEGVQYLGYELSVGNTSIRPESHAKMFNNLAKVITSLKRGKNLGRHWYRLNLKITGCVINNARRGWLMFFSQTEDIAQLSFLDRWLSRETQGIQFKDQTPLKTFRKSYYEIRYHLDNTDYIPNFDKFDTNAKAEVIEILSHRNREQVQAMDVEAIELEFARLVGREIAELERDISRAFS